MAGGVSGGANVNGHVDDPGGVIRLFSGPENATARRRIAMIGTYVPRKCGIATFTGDIVEQLGKFHSDISCDVYAMTNPAKPVEHHGIAGEIGQDDRGAYARTARRINESGVDAVWLQHEYGIFGGDDGEMVLDLVDRLAAPLIVTLHTVLADPSDRQRRIVARLVERASQVMVMARHSRDLLMQLYDVGDARITVIPHGAPDRPFGRQEQFKAQFGLSGRKVMTSFGLLGPGKGLERVIEALPAITGRHPDFLYRIVGATHPNLVIEQGEAYRERLQALAGELGVADHVEWVDRFVETDELLDQLEASDIYVTPYPNLQQSTSGTLSYAVALGKAVISTPYLHATELLSDGVGELVEPHSSEAIARAVTGLLDDPMALEALQRRAYARGRETIWPRFADGVAKLIEKVAADAPHGGKALLATPGLSSFYGMCDDTGMIQHAIGRVPDRRHGYCLDDNARALMLVNMADAMDEDIADRLSATFAAFLNHAWNGETRRFRNFMNYDRSWSEHTGSDDSNGRALWALGHTALHGRTEDLRWWARGLFDEALPAFEDIESPRALAFATLGAACRIEGEPDHEGARALLQRSGEFLNRLLAESRRPDWAWFEAVLGYDNPRLSQALIEAGRILDQGEWAMAGLSSLQWIASMQVSASGQFRPVGSDSFSHAHEALPFDQQPLEAQAAVEAAMSAFRADGTQRWVDHAHTAYRWFLGHNDRAAVLADLTTGECRDGITPRGPNRNCGAESILAFQCAHYGVVALARSCSFESGKDMFPAGDTLENRRLSEKPAANFR
ncbi:glycosyltransferase family 4 protein [Croceicoccus mobilis]|uniref:Glycosyl transferase n=1 Tax=Croceicoccus mobilis TaxID=1703339 RepID=A0A916YRD1_9SPHN|nr:glycosyltransferase family 4 protein [Croceicoccus mobilis]GGD57293.1 glycosyl transferase [Croceicoccus mobilis]